MPKGTPVPVADAPPSLVLDRYRLVRRLGAGGFGTVWLAHDEHLDREVAVKRIPVDGPEQAERARRESLAAARLAHPGIVSLFESGADDEACYLVSEVVRGETLAALEEQGALSDRDVARIGALLCDALAHAHGRGVVHRDVKPGNVIVPEAPESGGGVAKLTDFGIARVVGGDALTLTGDVIGTLAYMAPEQAEGRRITPAVDVYALGLVLLEAFAGDNPVRGATPAETARLVGTRLPALGRLRRDLPRGLCAAIDAAVDVDPARRGTLAQLRAALEAAEPSLSDEPGVVAAPGLAGATQRLWRGRSERAPAPAPWPGAAQGRPAAAADAPAPAARRRRRAGPLARVGAGLAAGGLAATAVAGLAAAPPPATPPAIGAAVAVAVALVPRLAWLAAAVALLGWLAAGGRAGTALVLAAAMLPVPPLLRRAPVAWSLPAAGPLLGLAGLAVAAPAVAGQASTIMRRAALGALCALWTVLAEPLLGRRLLAGGPHPPPRPWSLTEAWHGVLVPVADTRLAALAGVWALAAAALPLVLRGGRAATDAVLAGVWATALAAGTSAALAPGSARGLVPGAVAAAAAAVALRAARAPAGSPEPLA